MPTESLEEFPKVSNEKARLENLLRVAEQQWKFKNEEDRAFERRMIKRDLAALEAIRNG